MIPHSRPSIGLEETAAVNAVLQSGHLAQGRQVESFERACAEFAGRRFAVAVSSGTAALHMALEALAVPAGERVAMPSYCCAALLTAVELNGSVPCLCDIGDDFNLDAGSIPPGTRAAIVPSLFGSPARVPACDLVIEDVAQSFGGPAGRAAPAAVTSFYATKLITTGEGGMFFTDDAGLAEFVRDRRDYDNRPDFLRRHAYKMTDFQAAMGLVQLRRLPEFIRRRREIAQQYHDLLNGLPMRLPEHPQHVYFRYVIATNQRDTLEKWLNARQIEAKRPVYQPAHHYLGGQFPLSQRAHDEALSLPIYPDLTDAEVGYIATSIIKFWESGRNQCSGCSTGRGRILQSA